MRRRRTRKSPTSSVWCLGTPPSPRLSTRSALETEWRGGDAESRCALDVAEDAFEHGEVDVRCECMWRQVC
jgi:hypothetical protein